MIINKYWFPYNQLARCHAWNFRQNKVSMSFIVKTRENTYFIQDTLQEKYFLQHVCFLEYISSDIFFFPKNIIFYIFEPNRFGHFCIILNITHKLYYCCSERWQLALGVDSSNVITCSNHVCLHVNCNYLVVQSN